MRFDPGAIEYDKAVGYPSKAGHYRSYRIATMTEKKISQAKTWQERRDAFGEGVTRRSILIKDEGMTVSGQGQELRLIQTISHGVDTKPPYREPGYLIAQDVMPSPSSFSHMSLLRRVQCRMGTSQGDGT